MDCEYCGKPIESDGYTRQKRVDSKYCGDECRTAYHNEQRKLARAYGRIVDILSEVTSQHSTSTPERQDTIERFMINVAHLLHKTEWKCINCGHYHSGVPSKDQDCPNCQKKAYTYIRNKPNKPSVLKGEEMYKCKDCGQVRFGVTGESDNCSFCGANNWISIPIDPDGSE